MRHAGERAPQVRLSGFAQELNSGIGGEMRGKSCRRRGVLAGNPRSGQTVGEADAKLTTCTTSRLRSDEAAQCQKNAERLKKPAMSYLRPRRLSTSRATAPRLANRSRRQIEVGLAESPLYSADPRKCWANQVAKPSIILTGLETI